MDIHLTRLDQSIQFQLQQCGVVRVRVNDSVAIGYPFAVIGQARGGKIWTHVQGQRSQRVPDRVGYVIPPNLPIRSWSEGRAESVIRWSHVRYTILGAVDLFQLIDIPLFLPVVAGDAIGAINAEQVSILEGANAHALAAVARRQELGFQLLRILLKYARPRTAAIALLSGHARVQPALDYMHTHLTESISRRRLAACVHLSESRFHDVFKQATGQTALDYLRKLRVRRAQELLLSSDAAISEVGRQCGYPNQFHFSREFKLASGQSPLRYRRLALRTDVRGGGRGAGPL
jgi:AraC family transcriptional regulator of arabinose operon